MFGNLKTNEQALQEKSNNIGAGYQPLPSDIYQAEIVYAYGTVSKGGAKGLVVKFNILRDNEEPYPYTTTFWVSDKKDNTFFVDSNGNPHNLPGFRLANHLCAIVLGKQLKDVDFEPVTLNLYNFEQRKELPTEVQAIPDLFDQTVALAIKHVRENKQEKSTATGEYEPINEERFSNTVAEVFGINKDGEVYNYDELADGLPFEFANKWLKYWKDRTDDKYKEVKGASAKTGSTRKLSIS